MLQLKERLADGYKGKRVTVERHQVTNASGKEFAYEIGVVKNAVAVLPVQEINGDPHYVLLKNDRYPVGGHMIEVCAGLIDDGEQIMAAAARELKEETGYIASTYKPLGMYFTSPGWTTERIYAFYCEGLTIGEQQLEEAEEGLEVIVVHRGQAIEWVKNNTIKDAKTAIMIMQHACIDLNWSKD